jgi:hypothetical protein
MNKASCSDECRFMLTREPHPRTLRKNRAVWHCGLALDHRRACLFDPLVPGQRRIRYHVHASNVFKLPRIPPARWVAILSQKRAAIVSGRMRSRKEHKLVFSRPGRREESSRSRRRTGSTSGLIIWTEALGPTHLPGRHHLASRIERRQSVPARHYRSRSDGCRAGRRCAAPRRKAAARHRGSLDPSAKEHVMVFVIMLSIGQTFPF